MAGRKKLTIAPPPRGGGLYLQNIFVSILKIFQVLTRDAPIIGQCLIGTSIVLTGNAGWHRLAVKWWFVFSSCTRNMEWLFLAIPFHFGVTWCPGLSPCSSCAWELFEIILCWVDAPCLRFELRLLSASRSTAHVARVYWPLGHITWAGQISATDILPTQPFITSRSINE